MALKFDGEVAINVPVATPEEILAFANRVRAAGGAEVIEDLMPAVPTDARQCLIARNLNFDSAISSGVAFSGIMPTFPDGSWRWMMRLNMPFEQAAKIADVVEGGILFRPWSHSDILYLSLPETIGNAARAFDAGLFPEFEAPEINENLDLFSKINNNE